MKGKQKPVNKIILIPKEHTRDFIKTFNENKVSNEFLNSCKKAGKLFNKN